MIEVNQVCQSFHSGFWLKKVQVLHEVSFSVPKNKIFGLLGVNGAGKTTLIHLITGLKSPKSGSVTLNGKPASSKEARNILGYMPERPYFYEHLTGDQLLRYAGKLCGMPREEVEARIPIVLDAVSLRRARHSELNTYSKGMLQRIGIAQAILHDPEIVVFDEPMSGLDPIGRKDIRKLIVDLHREGKCIFFSSHVIPDVESICQEVALMDAGKLVKVGAIETFVEAEEASVELLFESERPLEFIHSEDKIVNQLGNQVLIECRDIEVANQRIKSLVDAQARLIRVSPVKKSLEDFF